MERQVNSGDQYRSVYEESLIDPEGFWRAAAESISWDTPPSRILEGPHDRPRWFPDAALNTCYNAVDRHVADGRGELTALRYDSAMTGVRRDFSYAELRDEVARFAGALTGLGVRPGDRVVIYLPMIPEAVIAMLACARLGAVHSVVFGGFAAKELAVRIDDAEPVLVLTASGGLEPGRPVPYLPIVAQALRLSHARSIRTVLVKRRQDVAPPTDTLPWSDWSAYSSAERPWLDWDEVVAGATAAGPVPVAATDPLYILYTSGTTGRPKGVVRDNGGHAVALSWSMRNIYDVGTGQVMWTTSDVGWVVGHSYIVYGPLLAGATTVMYEGKPVGTPDAGQFWRMIDRHRVEALFTAPTALRAIRKVDPNGDLLADHDIATLRTLFCAGERLDPSTYQWAANLVGRPVVDHWWQTETGWPVFANPRGLEPLAIKAGSASVPVPGFRPRVLDGGGNRLHREVEGNVVLGLPLPPGTLTGLWRDDQRYQDEYLSTYPGHYVTGDSGYFDEDGYVYILGRSDDMINVAGHRLSTGAMEAVLCAHQAVAECAVIGVPDELKGQRPRGYVVLKAGVEVDGEQLRAQLVHSVREEIGAIAAFREVIVVAALPKTRSGKILRKTMRQIVAGEPYSIPATIEDPNVLATFSQHLDG
jgi:propionyl-CoA synthetase